MELWVPVKASFFLLFFVVFSGNNSCCFVVDNYTIIRFLLAGGVIGVVGGLLSFYPRRAPLFSEKNPADWLVGKFVVIIAHN